MAQSFHLEKAQEVTIHDDGSHGGELRKSFFENPNRPLQDVAGLADKSTRK